MSDELREQLADIQHAIWAHWMGYMFGCGEFRKDGAWVMPAEKLERWWRQKETPYTALTDKERESDRHRADKVLAVVQPALAAANARAEAAEAERDAWCMEVSSAMQTTALAQEKLQSAQSDGRMAARERDEMERIAENTHADVMKLAADLAAAVQRAEAVEAHRAEWQQTAQAYGDYRQRCAENNTAYFDFWDWGMKGEPTGKSGVQP